MQQFLGLGDEFATSTAQKVVHGDAADDLAHCTLGCLLQGVVRIAHLEQVILGILHLVLHSQLHLDDVLILGQNLGLVADGAYPVDIDLFDRLDGAHDPMRPGSGDLFEGTQLQNHTALGRIDDVDTGQRPYNHRQADDESEADGGAGRHTPAFAATP